MPQRGVASSSCLEVMWHHMILPLRLCTTLPWHTVWWDECLQSKESILVQCWCVGEISYWSLKMGAIVCVGRQTLRGECLMFRTMFKIELVPNKVPDLLRLRDLYWRQKRHPRGSVRFKGGWGTLSWTWILQLPWAGTCIMVHVYVTLLEELTPRAKLEISLGCCVELSYLYSSPQYLVYCWKPDLEDQEWG